MTDGNTTSGDSKHSHPADAAVSSSSETFTAVNALPLSVKASSPIADHGSNFFDLAGGHPTFKKLVDIFYAEVAADDLLVAMYPEKDLEPAKERLLLFLEQYWGGPGTYSQRRGHPRLRARHAAFTITPAARDRWITHMRSAVTALDLPENLEGPLWDYLSRAADAMVNAA